MSLWIVFLIVLCNYVSLSELLILKEIQWSLLLTLHFHEILLFLIIFPFHIYLIDCSGQKVLCSLHSLHKLCSINVLYLICNFNLNLMQILLLLLFCLFPGQSQLSDPEHIGNKCIGVAPRPAALAGIVGHLFNLPLTQLLQERCPLEFQGVSPRTYKRKWHWVGKGWTMADTGCTAQTPLREGRAYSCGRWKCCQHMVLSCQHSSRRAGLKRTASPKVMSFPRAFPTPLTPTWNNSEVPLSLQSSPGSWLMLKYWVCSTAHFLTLPKPSCPLTNVHPKSSP